MRVINNGLRDEGKELQGRGQLGITGPKVERHMLNIFDQRKKPTEEEK